MAETNESEFEAWQEDIQFLAETLAELFESDDFRYYVDEINNHLYIELEGLEEFDEEEIVEIAEPLLSELDLDFEDIVLIPLG